MREAKRRFCAFNPARALLLALFSGSIGLVSTVVAQVQTAQTEVERSEQKLSKASENTIQHDQPWLIVLKHPAADQFTQRTNDAFESTRGFKGSTPMQLVEQFTKQYQLALHDQWLSESLGYICLLVSPLADGNSSFATLSKDARVLWIQSPQNFDLLSGSTKPATSHFDLRLLPSNLDGSGVVVALIDSAVDKNHIDLQPAVKSVHNFVSAGKGNFTMGETHGTAMAGVIAAKPESRLGIAGVAPGASVRSFRGCWEESSGATRCSTLSLARALEAVLHSDADILNLSLSGPPDPLLSKLLRQITDRGVVVTAAHDRDRSGSNRFPEPSDAVLMVKASRLDGEDGQMFSAPGGQVVTVPDNRYEYLQGHSVASAYTAGVLALYKQAYDQSTKNAGLPTDWSRALQARHSGELIYLISSMQAGNSAQHGGFPISADLMTKTQQKVIGQIQGLPAWKNRHLSNHFPF